ncbi:MAG: hypothetical protein KAR20_29020, partial [Candidatus Heimdallarchaeota archaeon]|nr:hypothetical protein [Candidatus Heimdallarchaeota archaeon]
SHVELEEEGIAGNDYRDWVFEKEFDVKKDKEGKIIRQDDHKIFADYIYGSCNYENENDWFLGKSGWVDCSSGLPKTSKDDGACYCPDEDDREDGFEEMGDLGVKKILISSASKIGLAPVRDLSPVYNVMLTTYKDGKEVCKAGTLSKKDKITDTSVNDLRTWAHNEDRNGNGIRGSYDLSLYKDANWWETLPQGITKNDVSPALVNLYFPKGKVKATGEGEGCLDSPTWIECQGIRVYYCGKFGYKSGSGNQPSEYYYWLDKDGEIHSRAGIKVLRDINPEYKGYLEDESKKGYSSINRKGANNEIIEITDSDAKRKQESKVGAVDYAKEYDLDLPAFIIPNPLLTANALGMRKMDDPTTYC